MLTTTLRFSTHNVPPAERLRSWYDVFDQSNSRRELSPISTSPFDMDVTVSNLGGRAACAAVNASVCVQRMTFTAAFSARRKGNLLADGNDDVILYIHQAGRRTVSQVGREAVMEPGGGILSSNAEPSMVFVPEPSRFVCIALSRKPMMALVPNLEDLFVRPLSGNPGVLELLETYLAALDHGQATSTPQLEQAVITHIYDLVAVAAGTTREHFQIASGRGISAARMHAIKADIARNLTDGDVSAVGLAARHRVTPRYIHKLFESEGMTLSKFVLGQRLSRVHRMLTDIRNTGRTIGSLAFAAGFGDLSTFNHAFRNHYGETPSDVRAAARTTM